MDTHYSAEATLFFDGHQISKQMIYSEFEAVLDSYVPLTDLADTTVKAVYLRINAHLKVTAAVFFLINFDKQGFVDKRWNIPLEQLADTTAKGPDLGCGPIRLSCYSHCSVEWHQKGLWDPTMDAESNHFSSIKKCLNRNDLGFVFNESSSNVSAAVEENQDVQEKSELVTFDDERRKAALLIKEQRLKYKLAVNKAEQDKRQLRLDLQEQLFDYQQKLHQLELDHAEAQSQITHLTEELASSEQKHEGVRAYYENKLTKMSCNEQNDLDSLKAFYESEMVMHTELAVSELKTELEAKDVEILYRKEKEQQLQQEILSLQKNNDVLINEADDSSMLNRMTEAGINFVAYHPGVGHLSILPVDIERYLKNSVSYVAEQCGVNEQLYRIWLAHFYKPVCQYDIDAHTKCCEDVPRIDDPSQFIVGSSDRCSSHKTISPTVISISKNGRQNQFE